MTEFFDYRVRFKKLGNAKYISHLDLTRCVQRALKRSGLPIWHTEGFNPHPYVSFPLPLPLGQDSEGEILDFRLTEKMSVGMILKRLNDVLPADIVPSSVFVPFKKVKEIEKASYRIILPGCCDSLEAICSLLSKKPLIVSKITKSKQVKEMDISQYIFNCEIKSTLNKHIKIDMILPAGSVLNINPTLITDLINKEIFDNNQIFRITRTAILTKNNTLFE